MNSQNSLVSYTPIRMCLFTMFFAHTLLAVQNRWGTNVWGNKNDCVKRYTKGKLSNCQLLGNIPMPFHENTFKMDIFIITKQFFVDIIHGVSSIFFVLLSFKSVNSAK